MGLLKAGSGALSGVLADSRRDFFYCDLPEADVLMAKGRKRADGRRCGGNSESKSNIISNGSIIAVSEGQCMLIVEQGAVVDVCAETGEFVYDISLEPSVFYGDLGESIKSTFERVKARFSFGGDIGRDQRVYFVNTKEISGNGCRTVAPVPYRIVGVNGGPDFDIAVNMDGVYSYRITDPLLFYKSLSSDVADEFRRDIIDAQMRSEILSALQPVFGKVSAMGIQCTAIPAHTAELADALNEAMSSEWHDLRGIEIESFTVNCLSIDSEDAKRIEGLQATPAVPTSDAVWMCGCGIQNAGSFCFNCGAKRS